MKLGFATDIHLNFLKDVQGFKKQERVGKDLARDVDALVLGGDLSEAHSLFDHMKAFITGAGVPVYFVLGNHDFWQDDPNPKPPKNSPATWPRPDIDPRAVADSLAAYGGVFLDNSGVVELSPTTALVGRSGWYDARSGEPRFRDESRDFSRIPRLRGGSFLLDLRLADCKEWADFETSKALENLHTAVQRYKKVFFVTHMPPWEETCWSDGDGAETACPSQDTWLPWSVNRMLGISLSYLAEQHPEIQFQVMSGHTHCKMDFELAPNLLVHSGGSRYGEPRRSKVWTVE